MAANVMEIYGSKVFNEHVMTERLPSATYKSLKNTLHKPPQYLRQSKQPVHPLRQLCKRDRRMYEQQEPFHKRFQ